MVWQAGICFFPAGNDKAKDFKAGFFSLYLQAPARMQASFELTVRGKTEKDTYVFPEPGDDRGWAAMAEGSGGIGEIHVKLC